MSDEQISLLERYLLEQDKDKFFATLVKNSETYTNMRLIDQLNRYGLDLPKDVQTELQVFLGESKNKKSVIQFKHRLLELQTEKDEKRRKDLIKQFAEKYMSVNFSFPRPANIKQSDHLKSNAEVKSSSTFNASDLGFEKAVEDFFNQSSWEKIRTFRPQFYHKFDLKRLLDKKVDCFEHVLNTVVNFSHIEDLNKLLKTYIAEKRKITKGFQLPMHFYTKMTLKQLNDYKEANPDITHDKNFITTHFQKTFESDLDTIPQADDLTPAEYRALLLRMLEWVKQLPKNKSNNSFASQLLREILQSDSQNNTYDKEVFLQYLDNPNNVLGVFENKYRTTLNNLTGYDAHWHGIHKLKVNVWVDETKLVEEYLLYFFKTMTSLGDFEKYFEPTYLNRQFYTAKILSGENMDNITKIFSEKELTEMRESKKLKFVSWNKDKFQIGEKIQLFLEIKNVQNYIVNIFEINTESYYRKNKSEINEKINLTGLIPSKTIEKTSSSPPIISQVIEFNDLLESKRGVYIVEFIGGGLYSRALIRIGALSLTRQVLSKGLLFHMIDEQKSVCHGASTHIFVGDKVFRPNAELDHGILIPYTDKDINEVAILCHEGYSELYNLSVPSERVTFDMGLLFNEESLISGNQVSFLLAPRVYVNGKTVAISTVKKLKAEITSTNDVGINNTNTFEDLKVEPGKDLVLNYLIPPKTESLSIRLSGKFGSSAQEKEIDVENSKSLTINRFRDRYIFYNLYLSQNDGKYLLHFLGKNGEPYANQKLSISFTPIYLTSNKTETFETDVNGEVHLGDLKTVSHFSVTMIDKPCTEALNSSYSLVNMDRITTLPRSFDIVDGEDICFPLYGPEFSKLDYELSRVCKDNMSSIIADCSSHLAPENGVVYLNKLPEGLYRFSYREQQVSITINVHKGKRWEASPNYLIKEKSIIKLLNQSLYIAYKDFKIDGKKVSFSILSNNMNTVQVHAFAYSYFPTTLPVMTQAVKSFKSDETTEVYPLGSNYNIYLSQKGLSDEIKYVLERKRKNTFMGNTLDKPSSLLKRHFLRETQQDQEQLKGERDFEAARGKGSRPTPTLAGASSRSASSSHYSLNHLNTFLGKEGWSQFNITPTPDGLVSFELPEAECYGTLVFIIKDAKNSIIESRSLTSSKKEITSVTLAESKKANKVYLYDRIAHKIATDEVCEIKDLAATELSLVEDVQTLFKMLKLISTNSQLDEWEFLSKWNTMTPEDQLKKYDKYISNELNLFAYFKDKEFFNAVVKDHLVNKSNKTLVDYFLLGNGEQLKKYLNPVALNELNILETCLVVLFFHQTHPQECQSIALNIRQKVATHPHNVKEFKRLFDTVLKARPSDPEHPAPLFMAQQPSGGLFGRSSNVMPTMSNYSMPQQPLMMAQAFHPSMGPVSTSPYVVGNQDFVGGFGQANIAPNNPFDSPYGFGGLGNLPVAGGVGFGGGGAFGGSFGGGGGGGAGGQGGLFGAQMESMNQAYHPQAVYDSTIASPPAPGGYPPVQLYDDFAYEQRYEQHLNILPPNAPNMQIERYRTLGVTNEYIERQYFQSETVFINEGKFWVDLLNHYTSGTNKPFLSENFIYSTNNLTEMLFVLSVIDLPFEKGTHASESANNQLKLKAGSNCIVFSKEIQEKGDQKLDLDILISQRFYDPFDRYVHSSDGTTKMLKNVSEFLVGKLYVSRVAITNSSETQHEINVVTEIPQGAVPVISLEYMKSTNMNVEPLTTQVIEFFFYFPKEGDFTCYPASINKDGCLVTTAAGVSNLKVVRTRLSTEMKTISDILSTGSKADILAFMDRENIHNSDIFQFSNIYWLLDDPEFYTAVLTLLKRKFIYDRIVWSFSVRHGDFATFVEYVSDYFKSSAPSFSNSDQLLFCDSHVLKVDLFKFKEYNPLVNPRVHDIGEFKHNILNRDFKATYLEFLKYLFQKTFLTSKDYTYFCTYLILQDRIDDCLEMYPHIKAEEISADMKIQFDYLTAYLDLYNDFPKFTKARAICSEYLTYPVFTWRNRFIDLVNQISEFDGETELLEKQTEETQVDKNQRQAKKEEYIAAELQGKKLKVTTKNLSTFTIKFYKIDLEIMFSQDPFLSVDKNDYSYVTPNFIVEKTIGMSAEYASELVDIPEALVTSNLIVQISSGALSENLTYFPTSMKVFIVKNFGQIKVNSEESNKPLSNVYIKCFAKKHNGVVSFYKDGYTDLRGTFEYTSVHNSSDFQDVTEFSILVFSDKHGALIKQTKPPTSIAKVEVNANKVISAKVQMAQENMKSKAMHRYAL